MLEQYKSTSVNNNSDKTWKYDVKWEKKGQALYFSWYCGAGLWPQLLRRLRGGMILSLKPAWARESLNSLPPTQSTA